MKKYREAIPVLEKAQAIYGQTGPAETKSGEQVCAMINEAQSHLEPLNQA